MTSENACLLLDSGDGRKLEQFGPYVLDRPAAGALWPRRLSSGEWESAHARFERRTDRDGDWRQTIKIPAFWTIRERGIQLKVSLTPFGHVGVFPEHFTAWPWIKTCLSAVSGEKSVLNLFAYTGAATVFCAIHGARVTHLDASRPMVTWANENARLNNVPTERVVWVVDDVKKFLSREIRRGKIYSGIILDPPTYGRGTKKELFKIEQDLFALLDQCRQLLSEKNAFLYLSCHTPGLSGLTLANVLARSFQSTGEVSHGEMTLSGNTGILPLPSGTFSTWKQS